MATTLHSPWYSSYWGAVLTARPGVTGGSGPPHPGAQLVSTSVTWPACPGGHSASCPSRIGTRQVKVERGHWEPYQVWVEDGFWHIHEEKVQRQRWVESGYWVEEPYTYFERVEVKNWVTEGHWEEWSEPAPGVLPFAPDAIAAATARWEGSGQARAEQSGLWWVNRNVDLALDATLREKTPACTSQVVGYEYGGSTYGKDEFVARINRERGWDRPKRDAIPFRAIVETTCGAVKMQFLYDLEFGIVLVYSARTG